MTPAAGNDKTARPGNELISCGHWEGAAGDVLPGGAGQAVSPAWGGVTRVARSASGAVADGCAGYGGLALAGSYLDAFGVRFRRLGHQDLQNAVLGGGFDSVG